MNTKINLLKIKICDQIWDTMPDCGGAKLCSKCSAKIHDFRGLTDWEIAVVYAHSKKRVCGIYDKNKLYENGRLNCTLTNGRKWILASILGIYSSGAALMSGQAINYNSDLRLTITPVHLNDTNRKVMEEEPQIKKSSQADNLYFLRGVIRDESNELNRCEYSN
ncbi:MAG: hypothetical protein ACJA01_002034 [Saprospiraceae bacterium]|jgi:hypothetical protein